MPAPPYELDCSRSSVKEPQYCRAASLRVFHHRQRDRLLRFDACEAPGQRVTNVLVGELAEHETLRRIRLVDGGKHSLDGLRCISKFEVAAVERAAYFTNRRIGITRL